MKVESNNAVHYNFKYSVPLSCIVLSRFTHLFYVLFLHTIYSSIGSFLM